MGQTLSSNDVLLVEDDDSFAEELLSYLSAHGLAVNRSKTLDDAFERISNDPPHVIVLDQFIGSTDTLSVILALRQSFRGGLMFLTGNAELMDRVVGLELGADDFVSKLISPREILARLRSLIRRNQDSNGDSEAQAPWDQRMNGESTSSYSYRAPQSGRWVLDTARHELFSPDGKVVHLTSAEFGTLRYLSTHRGEPVSRDDLSRSVLHRRYDPLDRSIDNLVSRLRKKFESYDPSCRVLKTVRGEGYVFVGFNNDGPCL